MRPNFFFLAVIFFPCSYGEEGLAIKRLLRSLVVIEDRHFGKVIRLVNAPSVNIMAEKFRGTNRLPFRMHEGRGSQTPQHADDEQSSNHSVSLEEENRSAPPDTTLNEIGNLSERLPGTGWL
jgi:hypothetical protein